MNTGEKVLNLFCDRMSTSKMDGAKPSTTPSFGC
jgi:hypothetical protein